MQGNSGVHKAASRSRSFPGLSSHLPPLDYGTVWLNRVPDHQRKEEPWPDHWNLVLDPCLPPRLSLHSEFRDPVGPNHSSEDTICDHRLSSQATSNFFNFLGSFPCESKSVAISAGSAYPGPLVPLIQSSYSTARHCSLCLQT